MQFGSNDQMTNVGPAPWGDISYTATDPGYHALLKKYVGREERRGEEREGWGREERA